MFLLEPARTPYDLNWRMFGVDVRVHPMFWLVAAIMGFNELHAGIEPFAVWVVCLFVSILIHELGHVFMFRFFGVQADAILYSFGGLAVPHRPLHSRWQRIAVSFAGPVAGFLLIGLMFLILAFGDYDNLRFMIYVTFNLFGIPSPIQMEGRPTLPPMVLQAGLVLLWINLFWGLVNLLPIFPLDGGQISRDLLDGAMPGGKGRRASLWVSLILAAVLTVHCLVTARGGQLIPFLPRLGGTYTAVLFGMLGIQNWQMLQQESHPPWRQEW